MKSKSVLAVLCSVMLVCTPLAEAAGSQAIGTLSSSGTTQVNGTVRPDGTTIFAGDHVISPDGSSAALSVTGGSRLVLAGSGSLQMEQPGSRPTAELKNGKLAVLSRAAAPILVEAAGTRITGAKGDAVYAVTVDGNNLQVMASKGEVAVEGAGRTIEVSEGNTLEASMAPPEPSGHREGPPSAATQSFFTFEKVVLITTGAVAVAALAVAIKSLTRTCRMTASPSTVKCD